MTFQDEVTEQHYLELLAPSQAIKLRSVAWGGVLITVVIGAALLFAMGVFFYAAVKVALAKGWGGMLAEPFIIILILCGLAVSVVGAFVLWFKQRSLKLFWGWRKGPGVDELGLREGLNLGPATFTFSDGGVKIDMPLDSDEISWNSFAGFRETASAIMLMFNKTSGVIIPSAGLIASGAHADARGVISSHLPEVA